MNPFLAALVCLVTAALAFGFVCMGILFLTTARDEHKEGKHRLAFWFFGICGIVLIVAPLLGVGAFIWEIT